MRKRWTISINRGRMTLPAELRRRFNLRPGDQVWIEDHDGKVTIIPTRLEHDELEERGTQHGDERRDARDIAKLTERS
jgi:AbrB family looped-hinge helix DNA binding protein